MKRTIRTASWLLSAALLAACGSEGEADGSTQSTTRALLNQEGVGGPSTPVDGDPELLARATGASVPELGFNLGNPDAPLKLIEFSDFGCGFCRRFHQETFATLREEFVTTGRVEWKFLPFITGSFENSLVATEIAECAFEQSQGLFEQLADRLWDSQADWKGSNAPDPMVRGWVEELGGDAARLDACLADDHRIPRIANATALAQQVGVRGTPTFWLVGYGPLQGALPVEVFQGILGAVLEEIESAPDSAVADSPTPN